MPDVGTKVYAAKNAIEAKKIAEARRDLPEVSVNDVIVNLIQDGMTLNVLQTPEEDDQIILASLTAPTQTFDTVLLGQLPRENADGDEVPVEATTPADPPPPPPSLVDAEPGTLTPTAEGTLGPGNILIFSGPPANPPPARPNTEPHPAP